MASTYVNDLRLNELGTGDGSGTWGTTTNTNLELIGEAFSYGTEAITTNADTHTTTIADGSTDPGRSMYLKYTGTLDSACTITIGPNTVSKVWIVENGTSGSQNIILSQGSGANITIPAGDTKVVYSDGAGSGAAFFDAFASLNVVDLKVQDDLTVTDDVIIGGDIDLEGSIDVNGTTNLDVVDIDGAVDMASTLNVSGAITGTLGTAAQTNITSLGTLTALTVDNINLNGSTITSDTHLNLDIVGDLLIDVDGAEVKLSDGGTQFGALYNSSNNFSIASSIQDQDIKFVGNDGGSVITLLRLDASDAGTAHFNHDAVFADNGRILLGNASDLQILHDGSNSYIASNTGDFFIDASGDIVLDADGGDIRFKDAGTQSFVFTQGTGSTMSVPRGNLTIDCAGTIVLDADSGQISFKDANTEIGVLENASSNFKIESKVQDKDIVFAGNDGGSGITALTFDMSDAGVAKFNRGIRFNNDTAAANELDDYEEGTFTPSNEGGTTGGFGSPSGTYIKIGKQITCDFRFETTGGVDGGLNYRVLRSFPYAMYQNDYIGLLGSVSAYNLDQYMAGYIIQAATGDSIDFFVAWHQNSSSGTRIRCSVTYRTV